MPAATRIADAVATTRARASAAGRGPALGLAQSRPEHPEAGLINFTDISAPTVVDPEQTIQVRAEVENNARSSGVLNDDGCFTGTGTESGHRIRVIGRLDGTEATDSMCHLATGLLSGPNYRDYTVQLPAPSSPGDYDIELLAVGADTDQLIDQTFRPLTVRDLSDPDPDPPPSDPDPDPEPPSPSPGLLSRLVTLLASLADVARSGIETLGDIVRGLYELLRSAGETIVDALRRVASWLGDNPVLLAAVATVAFVIAPKAVDFVIDNFTPIGWIKRIAGVVIPF